MPSFPILPSLLFFSESLAHFSFPRTVGFPILRHPSLKLQTEFSPSFLTPTPSVSLLPAPSFSLHLTDDLFTFADGSSERGEKDASKITTYPPGAVLFDCEMTAVQVSCGLHHSGRSPCHFLSFTSCFFFDLFFSGV